MFGAMFRADAIIVLGCRILPSGQPAAPAARRAATAASAYRAGVAPFIVASGGRRWGAQVEARVFRRELVRAGVPEDAVIEELCSLSTYENAIFSAALLRRLVQPSGAPSRPPRAAIVTCPFHLPRALANFRASGVDAFALPAATVPASIARRAYLRVHELICGWFDAQAMRHAAIFVDRAELLSTPIHPDSPPGNARCGAPASRMEAS
jgi:uncharacterized SAM-binding protein YcdF (DUF218 family)